MVTDLHKRLKQVLEGKSLRQVAEELDINYQNVQRYLRGRFPSGLFLTRLVEIYGVNINWLLTGEGEIYAKAGVQRTAGGPIEVPVVGYVSADPDESVIGKRRQDETVKIPGEATTVRVEGEAVSPVAWPGQQHLLIDPIRSPGNGDLAIIKTKSGKVYFKRYFYDKKRKLVTLLSVNQCVPVQPTYLEEKEIAATYRVRGVLSE